MFENLFCKLWLCFYLTWHFSRQRQADMSDSSVTIVAVVSLALVSMG